MKSDLGILIEVLLIVLFSVFMTACAYDGSGGFIESWESSSIKTYVPADLSIVQADAGYWFLGDTVSSFPECGPTPQRAEIFMHNGSKALRLTSNETKTGGCADNVWVAFFDASTVGPLNYNKGFFIPITNTTHISFEEEGELLNPQQHGAGRNCILPPCFDNISLLLEDNHGNVLAYVLQRYPDATPNEDYSFYREIFLDPDEGLYDRNLFDDFSSIPTFNPNGAQVTSIQFKVYEHGWGIIDDINISDSN